MSGLYHFTVILCLFFMVECDVIFKNETLTRTKRQNNNGCVLPPKPDFGDWHVINGYKNPGEIVPQNAVVMFSCNDGYKLNSPTAFMVCGIQWDINNIPQCKELCEPLYSTSTTTLTCRDANGIKIGCDTVIDGGTLVYECIPYYEVLRRSPKHLFCYDGKWSSSKPLCEPVCGNTVTSHTVVIAVGGGTPLEKIKYPWITAIYQKDGNSLVNICGGSIIARKLVLTAAHCVANEYGNALAPSNYKIAAAKLFNRYNDPRDTDAEYLDVESIVVNTDYRGSSRRYVADVALIITKKLFTLGPLVQPICLKGLTDITLHAAYDKGEIAGWGVTETNQPSDKLRYLEIPYKSQTRCEQELPADFLEKYKLQDKICAGFFNQNISVCKGDSGSGLAFKNRWDDDRYYIHGIVSLTSFSGVIDKCNLQQNSLYTSVAYYYSWIEKYVVRYQVEECQLPPYPINGRYEVEKTKNKNPGDSVFSSDWLRVSCNSGYQPISSRISCENANSNTLQCQPEAKCPLPSLPHGATFSCKDTRNVIVNCSKASHGTALHFICPVGYSSNGPRTRLCMNNSWGTLQTLCIPRLITPPTTTTTTKSTTTTSSSSSTETTPVTQSDTKIKVMCTYASWAAHKGVTPEDLNPYLCTHIYYAFAGIWDNGGIRVQDDSLDLNMGLYKRVTDLKQKNRNLKVLMSVGGDAASNSSLFSLVADGGPAKINPFIGSAFYFLQTYGFDGLNIDWHYPEVRDKDNYINFLRKIKDAFKKNGWLLSASVRSYPDQTGYDGAKMNEILDWVILKTFDMYGGWSSYTGEHTALYASPKEYDWEKQHLNVDASVQLWLKTGLSKSKMVISVAFYGKSFELKSENEHDIHAPIRGYGIQGGNVKYSEICSKYANWTVVWNDDQKSAYIYKNDQWISFDSKDAMWIKGAYVKDQGFFGVNVWPVDADDVFGNCGHKFALLKHLHGGLGHEVNWDGKA